ncbi:MAG TPA: hypothetical protein VL588_00515 [Bdellovibrionota bacterium]|nr:hypothetical protein [Bdellovibrionota bacterium]
MRRLFCEAAMLFFLSLLLNIASPARAADPGCPFSGLMDHYDSDSHLRLTELDDPCGLLGIHVGRLSWVYDNRIFVSAAVQLACSGVQMGEFEVRDGHLLVEIARLRGTVVDHLPGGAHIGSVGWADAWVDAQHRQARIHVEGTYTHPNAAAECPVKGTVVGDIL